MARILLAEDNPADVYLIRESLRSYPGIAIDVVSDGEEALEFLFRPNGNGRPSLIVLDLNLPKSDGSEVLRAVRSAAEFRDVPVMILTSSESPKDKALTHRLGADYFVTKPSDLDDFLRLGDVIAAHAIGCRAATAR